jgi:2-amino-4-hydroxy-6-hydroxymethyldihydropteridine diphosphokinase
MSAAFLGLGSNRHGPLGSPADYVEAALGRLQLADGLELLARSRLYRTAPWGNTQQDEFVNAVARISCELPPEELLDTLKAVERDMGRQRGEKWGPRRIDLDILTFGDCQLNSERLTLPHPLMHERAFVLVPLLELEPDFQIPGKGRADQFLMDEVGAQRVEPL